MVKVSAGLLPFRIINNVFQFLLSHSGGPFFKNKDLGFWSIVKGEVETDENLLETAVREFKEETGMDPLNPFLELGFVTQRSGKIVYAWAFECDFDLSSGFESNKIEIEWPPKSGKRITIPEIDKLEYFSLEEALLKVNQAQAQLILRLKSMFV